MKIISTLEASKLWNITPHRVASLAAQGRIPGAVIVNNRWMIPADAEKPADIRKQSKEALEDGFYIFPNIPYAICNEHPVSELGSEEKLLYDAFMQLESGEFENGILTAAGLLNDTKKMHIRIGALYVLCSLYVFTRRFEEAYSAVKLFLDACAKAEKHKYEITLMMHEFEFFSISKDWIGNDFSVNPGSLHSDFEIAYTSLVCCINGVVEQALKKTSLCTFSFETSLMRMEKDGYWCMSMYYHYYLSIIYAVQGNGELEQYHLSRAFEIAVQNNAYTSIASMTPYLSEFPHTILNKYPEEIKNRFIKMMNLCESAFSDFLAYSDGERIFSMLTSEDYILISYCVRNYTVKRIAESKNISVSKAKKQLSALYDKFGVKGKKELVSAYASAISRSGLE